MVAFLEDFGYLKYLINQNDEEKIDLLNQFYKKVKNFEEATVDPTLKNFMEEINLELESGEEGKLEFDPEKGPDMIKVMTIHGAKGLEFKYVFLANMVDKRFPTIGRKDLIELPEDMIKDIKPEGDIHLQEERRLCYVAMTRAKKGLYFTSALDYGGARKKKLSRFLIEMEYTDENPKSQIPNPKQIQNPKSQISKLTDDLTMKKPVLTEVRQKIKAEYLPEQFSYSQLAAFEKCPLQYKFNFILKVPVRGKAVFSFGKTMHNALFMFLKSAAENSAKSQDNLFGFSKEKNKLENKGTFPDLEYFMDIYEKSWIDEWYADKRQKEEYYKLGKRIIKDTYAEFLKNPPKILKVGDEPALEMPFNLKIGECSLRGVVDRIDEIEDGVEIIDYKTGKTKEKLAPEDKEQLLIYQIASEEIFKIKPKTLTYYYLDEGKKMSFIGSETDKEDLKEKITQEIAKIKSSDFSATPGWQCGFCDFKDICDFAER